MGEIVKTCIFIWFLMDFRDSGLLDRGVWTTWRLGWRMLGPSYAQDGSKMEDFRQVGDLGGHLGAKMGPKKLKKNYKSIMHPYFPFFCPETVQYAQTLMVVV